MDLKALETSYEATIKRFDKRQDRIVSDQGWGATVGAVAITREYFDEVAKAIVAKLAEIGKARKGQEGQGYLLEYRKRGLYNLLKDFDPSLLAVMALTNLLHSIPLGEHIREAGVRIGQALQAECWAQGLFKTDKKLYGRIERSARRTHGHYKYRVQAARSTAAQAGYRQKAWQREDHLRAGNLLIDCCVDALPDILVIEEEAGHQKYPRVLPGAIALAVQAVEQAVRRNPLFMPCVEPPKPWTGYRNGGFWNSHSVISSAFVHTYYRDYQGRINAAMQDGTLKPHMDAVNALQAVPWKINAAVLDVVNWAYQHNISVDGLPSITPIELPERLSDEDWQDEKKRKLQRTRINKIKARNRALDGQRVMFASDMAVASSMVAEPCFYTPTYCDFRGRVYPVTSFNFQRDDRVRALFLFANGMPIGEEGLYWLKVHTANCGAFDKIDKAPFEERVAWVDQNIERIKAVAWDAKGSKEAAWWTKADKPFLFLAACFELAAALACGPAYLTHLPVSFDGSCSGLQHLCAMTRAPEGELVNLTPSDRPQDVYQTVADRVRERIEADATLDYGEGPKARMCLEYGVTRKLVKRNVMTFCYSSKVSGMKDQQREDTMRPLALEVLKGERDQHPFDIDGDEGKDAAKYLAGHVYAAIEDVVHLPAQAMTFLRKLTQALAHESKAVCWTTPTGFPLENRYHHPVHKQITLWLQNTKFTPIVADGSKTTIRKMKAANSIAPNFVHACDAAHLALTVNAAVREGVTNLATVHDSFGCLAPQAPRFRQIIREQFVKMYDEHDVLAEVLVQAQRDLTVHNSGRLPALPPAGPLNLQEVLNAEYAFA